MQILNAKKYNAIVAQYSAKTIKETMIAIAKAKDKRYEYKIRLAKEMIPIKALEEDIQRNKDLRESECLEEELKKEIELKAQSPSAELKLPVEMEDPKKVKPHIDRVQADFMKFKQLVSAQDYHKAMIIYDYYVKKRFDKSRYDTGVNENPVIEIVRSIDEDKIKVLFILGDELVPYLDLSVTE